MANFPAFHVTGAVHHIVRIPGGSALYLGTCQSQPQVDLQEMYTDVLNDITGPKLPAQRVDNGIMGMIGIGLNWFDKFTWQVLRGACSPTKRGRFSRGSLIFGNRTFELWQVFDNALNPAQRANFPGLEMGWYWPQCHLIKESLAQIGNGKDEIKLLALEAHPLRLPDGSFYTCSTADADIAPVVGVIP